MYQRRRKAVLQAVIAITIAFSVIPAIFGRNSVEITPDEAQTAGASLLKRTIAIKPRRFLRWWRNPSAAEPVYDTWSWAPEIKFAINGPVDSGSQLYVDFETADGKPWFTQRMRTPTLDAGYWDDVADAEDITFDQLEKKKVLSMYRYGFSSTPLVSVSSAEGLRMVEICLPL